MNISSPNSGYPMPEGFSTSKNPRSYNIIPDSPSPSSANYQPVNAVNNDYRPININLNDNPIDHAMNSIVAPPNIYLDEPLLPRFDRKMYCVRVTGGLTEILNTGVIDSSVSFTVDRSICITGIQVPTQIRPISSSSQTGHAMSFMSERADGYSELLYACLLEAASDSRLTYTHSTQRVNYSSVLEIQVFFFLTITGNFEPKIFFFIITV